MGMIQEFKEFAMKGSLIDMAVGLVMGAAFGKVTSTFIDGMFMPIIGQIFQLGDMSQWKHVLAAATKDAAGKDIPEVAIKYGDFVGAILNFIIVAFIMFLIIKGINKMKKAAPAPAPAAPLKSDLLLEEIRDLMKKQAK